ncbi:MAG: transcriptional repressor [Salaquimonas sp.]|jgi:Fur family zinc uptake transcriptional regulator|nr:transcriptional repressor [Salaquimonas sp.]
MSVHEHSHERDELTRNQGLVLDTLDDAKGPLSAYSILDRLRGEGFRAPLQVYRALDKLMEFGLVHRLESLNAFVACRQDECGAHGTIAFAICEKCGMVAEFTNDEVAHLLEDWARSEKFELAKTTIELRGLCEACTA